MTVSTKGISQAVLQVVYSSDVSRIIAFCERPETQDYERMLLTGYVDPRVRAAVARTAQSDLVRRFFPQDPDATVRLAAVSTAIEESTRFAFVLDVDEGVRAAALAGITDLNQLAEATKFVSIPAWRAQYDERLHVLRDRGATKAAPRSPSRDVAGF